MLLLLSALAQAAPPLHVERDELVFTTAESPARAALLLSATGEPRIAVGSTRVSWWQALLVPGEAGWRELDHPNGRVIQGPDDVVIVRLAQDGAVQPGWLALKDGALQDSEGPLPEAASVGAMALDPTGRLSAVLWDGERVAIGTHTSSWTSRVVDASALYGAYAAGGAVWWFSAAGLSGPRSLSYPGLAQADDRAGGVDARGAPALAVLKGRDLTVRHAGGTARLRLPASTPLKEELCLAEPCAVTTFTGWFPGHDGVTAWGGGLLVPYVLERRDEQIHCEPFTGPMHPCDPVGPINTCPDPPAWSCSGPKKEVRELRAAWVLGDKAQDLALGEAIGSRGHALAVLSARAGPGGRLHLLVEEAAGPSDRRVRYVRLGPGEPEPPAPVQSALPVSVAGLDERSLGMAGFVPGRANAQGPAAGYQDGAAVIGGARGVGVWLRELPWVPAETPLILSVALEVQGAIGCAPPEIRLIHGGYAAVARLEAEGLTLRDRFTNLSAAPIPLRPGPHLIGLRVAPGQATLSLDEEPVATLALSFVDARLELAGFGAEAWCGPDTPPTETHFKAVSLGL